MKDMYWLFLSQAYKMYEEGVHRLAKPANKKLSWVGIKGMYTEAPLALPLLISGWEAFLNKTLLNRYMREVLPDRDFWLIEEEAERWSVERKALMYPRLILGKTFDKGSHPFQDFHQLVKLRNCIIHPTDKNVPIAVLTNLGNRGLLLPREEDVIAPWSMLIMSVEFLRWAYNTIIDMIEGLHSMYLEVGIPDWIPKAYIPITKKITEHDARELFIKAGLNPDEKPTVTYTCKWDSRSFYKE